MDFDFAPSCELKDNEKEYTVRFDVPGLKKEDISVELNNSRLTVSGERKEQREERSGKNYLSEI